MEYYHISPEEQTDPLSSLPPLYLPVQMRDHASFFQYMYTLEEVSLFLGKLQGRNDVFMIH